MRVSSRGRWYNSAVGGQATPACFPQRESQATTLSKTPKIFPRRDAKNGIMIGRCFWRQGTARYNPWLRRHLSSDRENKLAATAKWLETIVVDQKLCPFAAPLLRTKNSLRTICVDSSCSDAIVQTVRSEAGTLLSKETPHCTTLIVFDDNNGVTRLYMDFVRLSWKLQQEALGQQYQNDIQLVLFHPKATHQTYGNGLEISAADYTIRSPYPTLHLLRQSDLLEAVQSGYPNLDYLPVRNATKLQEMGRMACQRRLQACYKVVETTKNK